MSDAYKDWQMENYGNITPEYGNNILNEETLMEDHQRKFEAEEELWQIEQES